MLSNNLFCVSLVLILILSSRCDAFRKDMICKTKHNYIDSVVQFNKHKYFIINDIFYDYDDNYEYRRSGVIYLEVAMIDKMAQIGTDTFLDEIKCKSFDINLFV